MQVDIMSDPDWWDRALCVGWPDDVFFPSAAYGDSYRAARRVCSVCEVQSECLAFALRTEATSRLRSSIPYRSGMWGGATPRERDRMSRNTRSRVEGAS